MEWIKILERLRCECAWALLVFYRRRDGMGCVLSSPLLLTESSGGFLFPKSAFWGGKEACLSVTSPPKFFWGLSTEEMMMSLTHERNANPASPSESGY